MPKLYILAKRDGFRRAGIAFSDKQPTEIDTSTLKPEQIEAIKNDPNLVVAEAAPAGTSSDSGEKAKLEAATQKLEDDRKQLDADKAELTKAQKQLADDRKAFETEKKNAGNAGGKKQA